MKIFIIRIQINEINNKRKPRDARYGKLQFINPSRIPTSIYQRKLTSMIQEDHNLPFGNNINNHDESSSRIIFTNTNGFNADTDAHSLRENVINSKINTTIILLFA